MKITTIATCFALAVNPACSFQFGGGRLIPSLVDTSRSYPTQLHESSSDASAAEDAVAEADAALKSMPVEEQKEKIGNLVADDEWMGLSMELTELVRTAIIEDVKGKTSEFIGKEEYKVGDISKELDSRVKDEVAKMRGKDEYELGDLTMALDEMSKDFTKELTGKDECEWLTYTLGWYSCDYSQILAVHIYILT